MLHRLVVEDAAPALRAEIFAFIQEIAPAGAVNGLAQTLLRLTVPGVPDLYQGTELWDFSLVDPDNRRPVDFALRQKMLGANDAGDLARRRDQAGADRAGARPCAARCPTCSPTAATSRSRSRGGSPTTSSPSCAGTRPDAILTVVPRLPGGLIRDPARSGCSTCRTPVWPLPTDLTLFNALDERSDPDHVAECAHCSKCSLGGLWHFFPHGSRNRHSPNQICTVR